MIRDAAGRRTWHGLEPYRLPVIECRSLWLMAARSRAVALDQSYLKRFMDLQERIVFGISQVDLVEPRNWKPNLPIPSVEQEANIKEIVSDRSSRLSDTLGRPVEMIPFPNYRGYASPGPRAGWRPCARPTVCPC